MDNKIKIGLAEFIGTFALCFFGAGAIVMTHDSVGAGSLITVAAAHAIALIVFISGLMYISGGQFNPAVSLGVFLAKKQTAANMFLCIGAQLIGAIAGIGAMVFLLGQDEILRGAMEGVNHGATLGALSTGNRASPIAVFGLEAIMTFALVFVVLSTAVDDRAHKLGGVCIGLTVGACILAFGPITGASMNPARSLGPALFGHWDMHWVYWIAPLTGGAIAGLSYKVFFASESKSE